MVHRRRNGGVLLRGVMAALLAAALLLQGLPVSVLAEELAPAEAEAAAAEAVAAEAEETEGEHGAEETEAAADLGDEGMTDDEVADATSADVAEDAGSDPDSETAPDAEIKESPDDQEPASDVDLEGGVQEEPALAAQATSATADQAVAWANARAGEGWNVDYDGAYGVQCVDLILAYYDYLVGWHTSGNAIDYSGNSLPAGWTRVYSDPRPGDVIVWNRGAQLSNSSTGGNEWADSTYGHIGIVTGVNSGSVSTVETNTYTSRPAARHTRLTSGVACYIRPDFVGETIIDLGPDFYGYVILNNGWKHIAANPDVAYGQPTIASTNDILDPRQIWRFVRQGDGSYKISNAYWQGFENETWYLQTDNGGTASGTAVNMWKYSGSPAQNWFLTGTSGDCVLRNANCSLVMDAPGGANAAGTPFQIYARNGTAAQSFSIYYISNNNLTYSKPGKPSASSYTGNTTAVAGESTTLRWSTSAKKNSFDKRTYDVTVKDSSGKTVLSRTGLTGTSLSHTFASAGTYTVQVRAVNGYYRDWYTDGRASTITVRPATVDLSGATVALPYANTPYTGKAITPSPTVTLDGKALSEGTDYQVSYSNNVSVGTATVTVTGVGGYEGEATATFAIRRAADGWVDLPGDSKGYGRGGKLVTGWLDLDGGKYWFDDQGRMATGWTDLVIDGKEMHYYFRPSGNLARGAWADIDGKKYWFRASGNMATGWADIDGKKYWFDESGQMVTGWRDIDNGAGATNHYYFRASGAMATGWAEIDGEHFYFRPSGNMATGFTDVTDDAYKRYFDEQGRMLTGWQEIGGSTYYFRSSGAMQTGEATIDGMVFTFSDKGVLVG